MKQIINGKIGVLNLMVLMILMFVAVLSVNTYGLQSGAYMNITLDRQTPDPVEANSIVELKFTVRNAGSDYAKEVAVKILPEYPFTVVDNDMIELGTLVGGQGVGEGVTAKFKLKVAKDAPEGDHKIRLSYRVNGYWIETKDFTIKVQTQDAVLGIEEIIVIPDVIKPGEEFKFKVKVKNFADSLLKDVRVKLNFSGSEFATVDESNEKVIKNLEAEQTKEIEFNVISKGDIKSTLYSIPIEIKYIDNLGNSFSRQSSAGVVVKDNIDYLLNIDQTDVFSKEDTGKIIFSFYNKGTSDINFVTLELVEGEDYEILSPKLVYLGNVESDDFESADYKVHIKEVKKELVFNILLKYKDNYNKEYSREISLPLKLYSEKEAVKFQLKQVKSSFGQIIIGMIGVLVIAFWLFMLVDCYKSRLAKEKKIVWLVLIVLSFIFGAVAYYFFARGR